MHYRVVLSLSTLSLTLFLALGQIYPPPGEGTATPDATETAIPLLVTVTPGTVTPYPLPTPTTPPLPPDSSPPTNGEGLPVIGSGRQQGSANGATAQQSRAPQEGTGGPLFLWVTFLAAVTIFIAGITGSILLFTRRFISVREIVDHGPTQE